MAENGLIVSGQDVENMILYKRELNGLQTTVKENRIAQNEFRDSLHKTRVIMLGHSDVVRSTAREYENLHRKLGEFDWEDLQGDIAGTTRELRMFNDELERVSGFADKEITLTVLTKEEEKEKSVTLMPVSFESFKPSEYESKYNTEKLISIDASDIIGDTSEISGLLSSSLTFVIDAINGYAKLIQENANAVYKLNEAYSSFLNGELYAKYESAVHSNTVNGQRVGFLIGGVTGYGVGGLIGEQTGKVEAETLMLQDMENMGKNDRNNLIADAEKIQKNIVNSGLEKLTPTPAYNTYRNELNKFESFVGTKAAQGNMDGRQRQLEAHRDYFANVENARQVGQLLYHSELRNGEELVAKEQYPYLAMGRAMGLEVKDVFTENGKNQLDELNKELEPLWNKIQDGKALTEGEEAQFKRITTEIEVIGLEEYDLAYGDIDRQEKIQLYRNVGQIVKDNKLFHLSNLVMYNELSKGFMAQDGTEEEKGVTVEDYLALDGKAVSIQDEAVDVGRRTFTDYFRNPHLGTSPFMDFFTSGTASIGNLAGFVHNVFSEESPKANTQVDDKHGVFFGLSDFLITEKVSAVTTELTQDFISGGDNSICAELTKIQDWTRTNILDLAKTYFSAGARPINISIGGMTVREEADVYKIAQALADKLQQVQLVS